MLFGYQKGVPVSNDSNVSAVQCQEKPETWMLHGQINRMQLIRSNDLFVPSYFFCFDMLNALLLTLPFVLVVICGFWCQYNANEKHCFI